MILPQLSPFANVTIISQEHYKPLFA